MVSYALSMIRSLNDMRSRCEAFLMNPPIALLTADVGTLFVID